MLRPRISCHVIGGWPPRVRTIASHWPSSTIQNRCRTFAGYTVPHGPRKPIEVPIIHFAVGIVPSDSRQPAVWQSLHAPNVTRLRPRASSPAVGVGALRVVAGTRQLTATATNATATARDFLTITGPEPPSPAYVHLGSAAHRACEE